MIDALGHGPEAAVVARTAAGVIEEYFDEAPLRLLERCHQALRPSRGAAITLAALDTATSMMTCVGVGNVEGLLVHADTQAEPARDSVPLRGGVVGYTLPTLRPAVLRLRQGDLIVLATDGIRASFGQSLPVAETPREIADRILSDYRRSADDSLVLVARFLGQGS